MDRSGFYGGCVVTLQWVPRSEVGRSSASRPRLENGRSCCCGEAVLVDRLGGGGLKVITVLPGPDSDQLALVGLVQGLGSSVVVGRAHPAPVEASIPSDRSRSE